MKIGSLFSGYGGLDMGVQSVIGGEVAWHVEFDEAPSKILAHHWPDIPNYGDIRTVDWDNVPPVNILTGGFPCQDVSLAGRRAGITDGTRSGLWSEFARAIDVLRPELVVIENVRGLLSATADGPVESDPWGVGDGAAGSVVNAFGVVLGDLAQLGYDARWCGVRAADAGAPHGRFRVFCVAYPKGESGSVWDRDDVRVGGGTIGRWSDAGRSAIADSEYVSGYGSGRAWHGRTEPANGGGFAADAGRDEPKRRGGPGNVGSPSGSGEVDREERQRVRDAVGDRRATPSDTSSAGGREGDGVAGFGAEVKDGSGVVDEHRTRSGGTEWGVYEPAIRRWERASGRIAPPPTNGDGKRGGHRLSSRFVEWMMGLPDGHVTGAGLTRNQELKALGNGVVPQQAALAVRTLLEVS